MQADSTPGPTDKNTTAEHVTANVLHFETAHGMLRLKVDGEAARKDLKDRLERGESVTITISQKG